MPEGPEMFRVARRIDEAVGGQVLTEVWFAFEHLQTWSGQLEGRSLTRVRTLGKALLLEFDNGVTIYTHNQLYGRWMFAPADRRPDTGRQLRLAISTATRSALLYSASEIQVIAAGETDHHPFIRRAGLDILSSGASVDEIAEWLRRPPFARRRLGHLLLDQSFLAGVGNYLRSEILFLAGLHWDARPTDLSEPAIRSLAETAQALMWRSVETGGITNDAGRVRALKQAGWRRRDYRHYVFARDGQACHQCDGLITRHAVSGRRLYICSRCQSL